jgi:hypothetical protein
MTWVRFAGTREGFALHRILLRSEQFGNADEVIGDQVKQEVGADASDPAMLRLSIVRVFETRSGLN